MELTAGTTFGAYRVTAPLGRGGMASVYRARDSSLDRDVALKVLPPEFLHDPSFAQRFRDEARVAARLEHPHIVPVYAFGIEQGAPWMAMRLLTGGSLADRVRRAPLAPRELAALLREVAGALDYAHAKGVVHRDVKPANVLLDDAGRAYLADFGIAKMIEGSSVATSTGILGTPSYMAPEQALGEKVDRLVDVYALGVVAFECLTGRVPYTGTTPVAVLMKHVHEPVPEPDPAAVAAPLAAVLRRSLAKARTERWASAGAFADALAEAAAGVTPVAIDSLPTLDLQPETRAERRQAQSADAPAGGAVGTAAQAGRSPRTDAHGHTARTVANAGDPTGVETGGSPRTDAERQGAGDRLARKRPRLRLAAWALAGLAVVLFGAAALLWLWTTCCTPPVEPPASMAGSATPSPGAAPRTAPSREPSRATTDVPRVSRSAPLSPDPAPTPRAARRATNVPEPTPAIGTPAAIPSPTASPREALAAARPHTGPLRVYLEARLEPVLFTKTKAKDVEDSLEDLRKAVGKRDGLELVESRSQADAVVQVLERGREPAVIGVRKVRVRVLLGGETVELVGQDSMVTGFNTWSGAAGGAAKQVETWLAGRLGRTKE